MKFNLKLLFVVTTLLAIATVVTINVVRYQIRLQAHRDQFQRLAAQTSQFDRSIKAALVEQEDVGAILAAFESEVPENYISGGCGFSSTSGLSGETTFETEYGYSWQHPNDPNRKGTIELTLRGEFDDSDLEGHTISITHSDSAAGAAIADQIISELKKEEDWKINFKTNKF